MEDDCPNSYSGTKLNWHLLKKKCGNSPLSPVQIFPPNRGQGEHTKTCARTQHKRVCVCTRRFAIAHECMCVPVSHTFDDTSRIDHTVTTCAHQIFQNLCVRAQTCQNSSLIEPSGLFTVTQCNWAPWSPGASWQVTDLAQFLKIADRARTRIDFEVGPASLVIAHARGNVRTSVHVSSGECF